ncbi:NFATC2-interacting protein [Odontesthes bonariensis]|uniref:NFATC2-interacting protein n=1 Tax=Odontesthes bonariensis TaxID=219752 RepID=UPI003F5884CF
MAEAVSDCDAHAVKLPPKRRRILDPSAIAPVPVYSNKVSSSLRLKPTAALLSHRTAGDGADDGLWAEFSSRIPPPPLPPIIALSDSEDEAEPEPRRGESTEQRLDDARCPSPPPPESPVRKQSRKVTKKINEINRRLRAVSSVLSPDQRQTTSRRRASPPPEPEEDDDVIVTFDSQGSLCGSDPAREIPLKVRCRTDIHKIQVLSATRLSDVVTQLSVILGVPPPRLLLLRDELELPTNATVGQLGLGIADIIECVVMAAEDQSSITVRLQSKDRDSSQEFTVHREAPLSAVFSRYLSRMPADAQRNIRFHFDGAKVTGGQTPAQLDMEDGDIIEVWI